MRIAIITPVFWPEMGAPPSRFTPFVKELASKGHDVFVATGLPNYPTGKVYPGYTGKLMMREPYEGATILRTWYYTVPRNQSKVKQLLSYLSNMPAWFLSGWRAGKLDVVFISSPPLFVVPPGIWLAKLRGAKIVFDIRDVWPDEIVAMGVAKEDSKAIKLLRKWERRIYRDADMISCTTKAIEDIVETRGGSRDKCVQIPNGADIDLFRPLPADNEHAKAYGFGDRKVVMYSGLMGLKFGLEFLVEAAALMQDRKDIVFFLRGVGPVKETLKAMVAEKGMDNVIFGDEVPFEHVPYLVARADLCITSLQPDPYLEKIISVKIFEYLACEKPIVAALRGESARVIQDANGGIAVDPGKPELIANAIRELIDDPERRLAMGKSGRLYVEEHYSRSATARKLEQALVKLVGKK